MTQDWITTITSQGLSADGSTFGQLNGELAAARDESVIVPLVDQGLIRTSGPDAADFLHNLLTNDIKGIGPADARLAGFCTAKGRLLALFTIWRDADDLLLMLPRDVLPGILKKLQMYVLRAKVKLTDATGDIALIGLAGSANLPGLEAIEESRTVVEIPSGKAIRLGDKRWVLAVTSDKAIATWQEFAGNAKPVGLAAWQWQEIAAGQPRVVAATQEAFVPQMLNMELPAVGGVSFTKGCYPGQEIVARTQYLGKVKRRTFRARLDSPTAAGTHVFAPETGAQHCGSIVSMAPSPTGGFECLVCVQIGAQEAGVVTVGAEDGPRLEFLPLPYPLDDAKATVV